MRFKTDIYSIISFLLIILLFLFLFTQKISLVSSDLGRHLENGKIFIGEHKILNTNYYSYTEPDFPTVTHHWGSGVIFYLVYKLAGFSGLSIFNSFLGLITFLIFFNVAKEQVGTNVAGLISLLIMPVIVDRIEVRPEIFSYLLSGIFFCLLLRYRESRLRDNKLYILPVLTVIWVNLHIYFFVGYMLIGIFLFERILTFRTFDKIRTLFIVFILSLLGTFIGPFGIKGAFAPYNIFQNYGYMIVENQPVWFIEKLIYSPSFLVFKIIFAFLILSCITVVLIKRKKIKITEILLAAIFSTLAWFAIRNFSIFGLFTLVVIASNISMIVPLSVLSKINSRTGPYVSILLFVIFILTVSGNMKWIFARNTNFGLGLMGSGNRSAKFFKSVSISGPIFNNYDIGSFLIFNLFPEERVFVDNRPEAYSVDFFRKIYIPMQDDENIWHKYSEKYNFNAIFFYYRDATPWAQKFLIARINDPSWVPVYADETALIIVKNNDKNKKIISENALPTDYFRVVTK